MPVPTLGALEKIGLRTVEGKTRRAAVAEINKIRGTQLCKKPMRKPMYLLYMHGMRCQADEPQWMASHSLMYEVWHDSVRLAEPHRQRWTLPQ